MRTFSSLHDELAQNSFDVDGVIITPWRHAEYVKNEVTRRVSKTRIMGRECVVRYEELSLRRTRVSWTWYETCRRHNFKIINSYVLFEQGRVYVFRCVFCNNVQSMKSNVLWPKDPFTKRIESLEKLGSMYHG